MESDLAERFREGDHEAFAALYDQYAPLVRAVSYRTTGQFSDAQDLAQEVFRRAWKSRDQLREPAKFGSWLIGISRKVGLEWRRKHGRDHHQYGACDEVEVVVPQRRTNEETFDDLRHALQQLSDTEQLAVDLFYLQDEPVDYARTLLGLSRSGFYKLLARARKKLSELLRECEESRP